VLVTTIILAGGFAINGFSVFPTNQRVGILGALVVTLALLGDLFVLPPLLLLWQRRGRRSLI
jgi:predicted RND superfamily exporter protein